MRPGATGKCPMAPRPTGAIGPEGPKERKMTFDELAEKVVRGRSGKMINCGPVWAHNIDVLKRANTRYLRDNLDPSSEESHLSDFLVQHGKEDCYRLITFSPDSPHCIGGGVTFVDISKLRRRLEDALRKTAELEEVVKIAQILGVKI